ncbi:MAG: UDP-N-acetylmuramoyl-L-alanine--D-glutamate ligase [Candidatus Hydrogenedentes bacterium]|nr:UDP-N-acetylmuramoyl-L-alanine--D-glutamate ligase [Candidatus Hydrogenedentota bacterium]
MGAKVEITLKSKRVTVIGMGRSAMGAVRLLLREGARPFVSDHQDTPALLDYRGDLEHLGVPYEVGGHTARALDEADVLVLSPGVPADAPPFAAVRARGVPVLGELELAARFCHARILAVTGTNGKTTTTELLYALLRACGHTVALAGNNATPLSAAVLESPAPEFMVLEVSSYQLETSDTFRPWIGAVLNVTSDHLARHGTMTQYAAIKNKLFARQGAGDAAVLNADDPLTAAMRVPSGVRRRLFSIERTVEEGLWTDGAVICDGTTVVARREDTPLRGCHNLSNVLAALAMARAGGFEWERCLEGLRGFRGVEHRIEYVAEADGVAFYNDSKSTNVDSLRVALESFTQPLVLIAGGRGKAGSDYASLLPLLRAHVRYVVALGEEAPLLLAAWNNDVPMETASAMPNAVELAMRAAEPGDVVLLSPGCASFDLYNNFEERGTHFKECVSAVEIGSHKKEQEAKPPAPLQGARGGDVHDPGVPLRSTPGYFRTPLRG